MRGQGSAIYVVARPELGVRHLVPCPDVALNDLLDAQMLPDVAAADRDVLRPWAVEDVMAVAHALVLVPVSQHAEEGVKGVARLALGGPASGRLRQEACIRLFSLRSPPHVLPLRHC